MLENQTEVNETDLQKISLIRSFVIPNTKEDLFEFLVLASSNINLQRYNDFDSISESEQAVSDAWEAKFEQAYEKAKLSFGSTTEFKKIQSIYDKKSGDIKKSKKKRTYFWVGYAVLFICIGVFSFGGLFMMTKSDDKKIETENARLEAIVEEVYEALEDENYVLARAKAASLTFSGPNTTTADKASEKWDKTRTELLSIIEAAENGEEISLPNNDISEEDTNQANNNSSNKKPLTNTDSFDSAKIIKQLKVTEHKMSDLGDYYTMLIIENPTQYNLSISADAKFYNKSGKLVGAESDEVDAFEKGTKTIMIFSADEEYERMDYEFTVEEEDYYNCVISSLKYETVRATEKEILSVTNKGGVPAEFVEVYALFFKGGKLVDYDWTYMTDDDSEIKPNKTITEEIDCYEEYDKVEFYFTGRAEKE